MYYLGLGKKYGFTLDTPIKEMSPEAVNALLYGTNGEKIEMHRTNEFGSGVYYTTFEAVSYTHLDVYKRQGHNKGKPSPSCLTAMTERIRWTNKI